MTIARVVLVLSLFLTACSGGGGGGDQGSGNDVELRRTTDTGIRVIHAGVEASPVEAYSGTVFLQRSRYNTSTFFVPLGLGSQVIALQRQNSPGLIIGSTAVNATAGTEYTVVVTGVGSSGLQLRVFEESIERPEKGICRLRVGNFIKGGATVTARAGASDLGSVSGASFGPYSELSPGPQVVQIVSRGGVVLQQIALNCPDRGDVAVVASGSAELGVTFAQAYLDLD